jgi:hypothetical protein
MTEYEEKEYCHLLDIRAVRELTNKEYKKYVMLVNKSFLEGIPKITETWMEKFNKKK